MGNREQDDRWRKKGRQRKETGFVELSQGQSRDYGKVGREEAVAHPEDDGKSQLSEELAKVGRQTQSGHSEKARTQGQEIHRATQEMNPRGPASAKYSDLRIGISGWTYPPWRGVFYPKNWVQKRELEYASRELNSIEINGSFYSLQLPGSYRTWYAATPPDFLFSVKGGRFITHMKKLRDVEKPLANFFASGVLLLKEKLGPILWQLPPHLAYNEKRLADFFQLLPRSGEEAAALAEGHDEKVRGRCWTEAQGIGRMRHCLEVRHPSFVTPDFIALLRAHDIGLVVADTAGKWPFLEDVTSDFVYVRLHGDKELYVSGYSSESLDAWAHKIRTWARGGNPRTAQRIATAQKGNVRDVFVYFDNDVKVHAPFDAIGLAQRLGLREQGDEKPDLSEITETARLNWPAIRSRWRLLRTNAVQR